MGLYRDAVVRRRARDNRGRLAAYRAPGLRSVMGASLLLFAAVVVFASIAELPRKVRVRGKIAMSDGVVRLHAPARGRVRDLGLRLGQQVAAGTALFAVSAETESVLGATAAGQLALVNQQRDALRRELDISLALAATERRAIETRRQRARASLAYGQERLGLKQAQLQIANEAVDRILALVSVRHASKDSLDRRRTELLALEADVASLGAAVDNDTAALALFANELQAVALAAQQSVSALRRELAELEQRRLRLTSLAGAVVRSPVRGRVSALLARPGQFVSPAEHVLSIIPADASVVVNLAVPSTAIGAVTVGMPVLLSLDAYPRTTYGLKQGRVVEVSGTQQPLGLRGSHAYRVVVTLPDPFVTVDGETRALPMDSGLSADLIIARETVVRWLFNPLFAAFRPALQSQTETPRG